VAAVAGADLDIVAEALQAIDVEYEELPAVFDPLEATQQGAPLVHDEFPGNIGPSRRIRKGNPERIFSRTELVFEDAFRTQMIEHCSIETHAASPSMTLLAGSPFGRARRRLSTTGCSCLERFRSDEQVEDHSHECRGRFWREAGLDGGARVHALAKKSGHPVKIVTTGTRSLRLNGSPSLHHDFQDCR